MTKETNKVTEVTNIIKTNAIVNDILVKIGTIRVNDNFYLDLTQDEKDKVKSIIADLTKNEISDYNDEMLKLETDHYVIESCGDIETNDSYIYLYQKVKKHVIDLTEDE